MAFQQLKLGDRNRVINNFYLAHLNDGSKFTVQQSPVEWGDIPYILPYVPTSPPQGWPAPPLGQPARPRDQLDRPQGQPARPHGPPAGPQSQPTRPQGQPARPQGEAARLRIHSARPQVQPARWTNGRRKFLHILQDFVPFRLY